MWYLRTGRLAARFPALRGTVMAFTAIGSSLKFKKILKRRVL